MSTSTQTQTSIPAMLATAPAQAPIAKGKPKLPSEAMAKSLFSQAWKEQVSGEKLIGTAEQRMAYAVKVHMAHAKLAKSNLPDLLCTSKEDKNTLRKHLSVFFAGERPNRKKLTAAKGSIIAHEILKEHTAMTALISAGTVIATFCEQHDVDWTWYNAETNCWDVKPIMLLPADCTPVARLATEKRIALDGRTVAFMKKTADGGDVPDFAKANVKHMRACLMPKKVEPDHEEIDCGDLNVENPEMIAKAIDVPMLMAALHQALIKDKPTEPPTGHDYSPAFWNMFADLAMLLDESLKSKAFRERMNGNDIPKEVAALAAKRNVA